MIHPPTGYVWGGGVGRVDVKVPGASSKQDVCLSARTVASAFSRRIDAALVGFRHLPVGRPYCAPSGRRHLPATPSCSILPSVNVREESWQRGTFPSIPPASFHRSFLQRASSPPPPLLCTSPPLHLPLCFCSSVFYFTKSAGFFPITVLTCWAKSLLIC